MTKNVFVATYGSLRVGMENESVNFRANAKYIGQGLTKDNYDLFQYGGAYFPSVSLAHNASEKPVVVDVYATTQEGLEGPYDCLEGFPSFYNRTLIPIKMDDGSDVEAWIYHIDKIQPNRVESGDWVKHKQG